MVSTGAILRAAVEIVVSAVVGLIAIVLPIAMSPRDIPHQAVFAPAIARAVEGMNLLSLALLLVAGFTVGLVGRTSIWLIGPATMLAFPIWSAIDMAMGSGGHNLFPIEWAVYGLLSLIGLAGAALGRLARHRFTAADHARRAP